MGTLAETEDAQAGDRSDSARTAAGGGGGMAEKMVLGGARYGKRNGAAQGGHSASWGERDAAAAGGIPAGDFRVCAGEKV